MKSWYHVKDIEGEVALKNPCFISMRVIVCVFSAHALNVFAPLNLDDSMIITSEKLPSLIHTLTSWKWLRFNQITWYQKYSSSYRVIIYKHHGNNVHTMLCKELSPGNNDKGNNGSNSSRKTCFFQVINSFHDFSIAVFAARNGYCFSTTRISNNN